MMQFYRVVQKEMIFAQSSMQPIIQLICTQGILSIGKKYDLNTKLIPPKNK